MSICHVENLSKWQYVMWRNFSKCRFFLHGHRPWCPWQIWSMNSGNAWKWITFSWGCLPLCKLINASQSPHAKLKISGQWSPQRHCAQEFFVAFSGFQFLYSHSFSVAASLWLSPISTSDLSRPPIPPYLKLVPSLRQQPLTDDKLDTNAENSENQSLS